MSDSRTTRWSLRSLVIAGVLCGGTVLGWTLLKSDADSIATGMLGMYRERWFLLNVGLTYAAAWSILLPALSLSKRGIAFIAAGHVGLLMAIGFAEATAYLGLVDYRTLTRESYLHDRSSIPDKRLRQATRPNQRIDGHVDPNLVRLLGIEAEPVAFSLHTDEFGFRNSGTKRDATIFCLGDSQLVGGLVPIEQLLTERLQDMLGTPVMNVSESAAGMQEELILLDITGIALDGKLVLQFISEPTDLNNSVDWYDWLKSSGKSAWPRSGLLKTIMESLHQPAPGLASRSSALYRDDSGSTHQVFLYLNRRKQANSLSELPRFIEDLIDGIRSIEERGGRYAMVLVPSQLAVLHDRCTWPERSLYADWTPSEREFAVALAEICAEEKIPYLDLAPPLRKAARAGRFPYDAEDTHMNAVGHEVAAEAIVAWIRSVKP